MPTILLVRHAKPDFDTRKIIRGDELGRTIEQYDAARLATCPGPWTGLQVRTVCSSDKTRSVESARALFPAAKVISSELYGESGLPTTLPRWVRLPFVYSLVVARCAWILGYAPGAEKFSQMRSRAIQAANELITYANKEEPVALVGHGLFNRFIGSRLKALGWTKQRDEGNAYGSWQLYRA